MQEWSKSGGKSFDAVTFTDSSGDVHNIAFPGAINRLKYRHIIPYITINGPISPIYSIGGRIGVGRVDVQAEYDSGVAHSGNTKFADNAALLVDLFVERHWRGTVGGVALRYISARNDTSNYNEYINMGSAQVVVYFEFLLETLGLL